MAESVKPSEDPKVAADVIEGEAHQRVKIQTGADGTAGDVHAGNPLPVEDGDLITLQEQAKAVLESILAGPVSVDDSGGSLTVDGLVSVSSLPAIPAGANSIGRVFATVSGAVSIEGEPKVKISVLEGEPKIKVSELPSIPAGANSIGKVFATITGPVSIEGEPNVKVTVLPALPAGGNVIGKVSATVSGTVGIEGEPKIKVSELPAIPAGANVIGKVFATVSGLVGIEGEPKIKISVLEGEPNVKIVGEPKVKISELPSIPAGTNLIGTINATFSSLPAGTAAIGQVDPRGNVAHDGVDSGNPVKVGARARTALPTAVSQDDRTDNISDKYGRQVTTSFLPDTKTSGQVNLTNNTSTEVLAAAGAEARWVVTSVLVTNASTSVSTKVEITDEETAVIIGYSVEKGGGFTLSDPGGLFIGTTNKKIKAKCVTTGADVNVFISAHKIPA